MVIVLLVFTKIINFTLRHVEYFSYMVDIFLRRVDFLLAVFFCLALSTTSIRAQTGAEDYLVIDRLSREGGLPDQDINGIYFDSKGYAWIGTFGGGLVRYDGDSFIKFSQKEIPGFMGVTRTVSEDCGCPERVEWKFWTWNPSPLWGISPECPRPGASLILPQP